MSTPALSLRRSSIHGVGCFLTHSVSSDAIVNEYTGERIGRNEAVRRNRLAGYMFGKFVVMITEELFLDGSRRGNRSRYINHACEPNCYIRRSSLRVFIVARRQLRTGEEATIDYDFDPQFRERCRCGMRKC